VSEDHKGSRELRQELVDNREQIEADLSALGDRLEETLNLRHMMGRHPWLLAGAGAVLGVLVVRHPALVMRNVGRLAGWGAPLLLSVLLRRDPEPEPPQPFP
jgi:hypothetical protein